MFFCVGCILLWKMHNLILVLISQVPQLILSFLEVSTTTVTLPTSVSTSSKAVVCQLHTHFVSIPVYLVCWWETIIYIAQSTVSRFKLDYPNKQVWGIVCFFSIPRFQKKKKGSLRAPSKSQSSSCCGSYCINNNNNFLKKRCCLKHSYSIYLLGCDSEKLEVLKLKSEVNRTEKSNKKKMRTEITVCQWAGMIFGNMTPLLQRW